MSQQFGVGYSDYIDSLLDPQDYLQELEAITMAEKNAEEELQQERQRWHERHTCKQTY